MKSIPVRSDKKEENLLSLLLFEIVLESLESARSLDKEMEGMKIGKEEIKLSIHGCHNCLCRKFQSISQNLLALSLVSSQHARSIYINI